MKSIFVSIVALVIVMSMAGCATVSMKSKLDKTISLTDMEGNRVREIDVKQRAIWLLWGSIPLSVPKIDDIIGPHVADRTGIQNLEIESKYSFLDGLITTATVGILTMRTVTIEGEVYDYH